MQPKKISIDPGLLRAAVYARKSNEQDASVEDKSTTRQVENATAFAGKIGGVVVRRFEDDGVSGTEFAKRPGLLELLDAARQKPKPFDAVIMSEGSRLGRESIETAYIVKQLIKADVRVFNYLDGRERTLNNPTDKLLMQLESFADEMEVFRASQRVVDAQTRLAKAGRQTGGPIGYAYRSIATIDAAGRRVVSEAIDQDEAATVRRIFERSAAGAGDQMICNELNRDGVPPNPASAARRRPGREIWTVGMIKHILRRTLYRGVKTWRKTRTSDRFQENKFSTRPESDWITAPREDLRIVSDDLWFRANQRRTERAATMKALSPDFMPARRARSGAESPYVLSGFIRCAACGGGLMIEKRGGGANKKKYKHGIVVSCRDRRRSGPAASRCSFRGTVPLDVLDRLVLDRFRAYLTPETVDAILDDATKRTTNGTSAVPRLEKELAKAEKRIANWFDAIGDGGEDWKELRDRISAEKVRAAELRQSIATAATAEPSELERSRARLLLRAAVARLRANLDPRDVPAVRQLLRDVLQDRPILVYQPSAGRVGFRAQPDLLMVMTPGILAKPLPESVLLRLVASRKSQPYGLIEATAAA